MHQVCSCVQCAIQKKLVYCGALPCLAHLELCGAETFPLHPGHSPPQAGVLWSFALPGPIGIMWSRDLPLSTQGTPPPPHPSQATGVPVYLQLPRKMNLDSVHSRAAQSRTWGSRTVYVHIVLHFSSNNTAFWNIP
jgi:hypothetical protein